MIVWLADRFAGLIRNCKFIDDRPMTADDNYSDPPHVVVPHPTTDAYSAESTSFCEHDFGNQEHNLGILA